MTPPPLIAVRRLAKRLGDKTILADISLDAHEHELVALLGPSGAGKTTLFRCLTGLLPPDSGTVLDGTEIADLRGRARRQIAVVFQQFNLVGRLRFDNVLAGRLGHVPAWRGWTRQFTAADQSLAQECLDRVGLSAFAARRADTLSGGQQQRVAIARALAQQPRLIVADEPVASLDPDTGAAILALLRDIARSGPIAICSLHQVELARAHATASSGHLVTDSPASQFGATPTR